MKRLNRAKQQHHLAQDLLVEEVLDADAEARDLVAVRRADAATGGADLGLAEEALGRLVESDVVRRDQVRVGADDAGARCRRRAPGGRRSPASGRPGRRRRRCR